MAPYTPIGVDPTYHQGAQSASAQQRATGQYDAYLAANQVANYAGPVAWATAATYGSQRQADITAAAVGATANSMSPGRYSGALYNYGGGGVGVSGTTAGLTYGGGVSAVSDPTELMNMAQQQLAESQASSLALIGIQNQIGMDTRFYTALSTMINQKDSVAMSIIRNAKMA